jgi:hypothetical protein
MRYERRQPFDDDYDLAPSNDDGRQIGPEHDDDYATTRRHDDSAACYYHNATDELPEDT